MRGRVSLTPSGKKSTPGHSRRGARSPRQKKRASSSADTGGRGRQGRQVRGYRPLEWHLWQYESRDHHEHTGNGGDQFDAEVRSQDRIPSETIEVGIVAPPERGSELLKLKPGELIVVRRRVRLVDGTPYQ